MEPSEPTLKKFCPKCGQKLAVPTSDLSLVVQCPRCATQLSVGEFVGVNHTLPVVALGRPPPQVAPQPPPSEMNERPPAPLAATPADALRSAGASVVAGAASTVSLGLRIATRLDEALHGHRGKLVLGGALLGVLSSFLAANHELSWVRPLAGVVFVAVLVVAFVATLGRCIDDEGHFRSDMLWGRIQTAVEAARDEFNELSELPVTERWTWAGRALTILGLVSFEALDIAAALSENSTFRLPKLLSGFVMTLGVLFTIHGWAARRRLTASGSTASTSPIGDGTAASLRSLPPVIDLDATPLTAVPDPLLDGVLDVLSQWPAPQQAREHTHRDKLYYLLRRKLQVASVDKEVPKSHSGQSKRRIDIVARCRGAELMIELKGSYKRGDVDRACSQIRDYVTFGPVLVVLCNRSNGPHFAEFQRKLEEMNRDGMPVVSVVAASRAKRRERVQPAGSRAPALPSLKKENELLAGAVAIAVISFGSLAITSPSAPRRRERPSIETRAAPASQPALHPFGCTARPDTTGYGTGFQLRPVDDIRTRGPAVPSGTAVEVTGRGSPHPPDNRRSFMVRTPNGQQGYVFLSEARMRLEGNCSEHSGW